MARPKGYADWNPKPDTLALIGQVEAVLDEYRAHLPLTARQVFYRLVGAYGYDKTEKAYSRLCEHLVRARRARMIPFDAIRDDGTTVKPGHGGYQDPRAFWDRLWGMSEYYGRPPRQDQDYRIELWCEAAGMAPQLARVANPLGVPVYSTGGFSSVTVTHEIANRVARADSPTVFLHVGDFDPSGESIFEAMAEDVRGFLAGSAWADPDEFEPRRVALLGEHVEKYGLDTAPPKASDSRSVNWVGETCQAEAMPPDTLAKLVRQAIDEWTDHDTADRVEQEADEERAEIEATMDRMRELLDGDDE